MISTTEGDWYSASDLLAWLGCHHRTSLDARSLDEPELRDHLAAERSTAQLLHPDGADGEGFESPAQARGDMHERAMLQRLIDEGHFVVSIARPITQSAEAIRERAEETLEALRAGADVIFQATLLDPPWFGYADFLVRVDGVSSAFGDYSYEIRDTKLARQPSASALLQMAHYGAILRGWQGADPPSLSVWLGTGAEFRWKYSDAAPYLVEARTRFLEFCELDPPTVPEPVSACPSCRWLSLCEEAWGADDLRNVHRLGRRQRSLLHEVGITTIAELAVAPDDRRPPRMGVPTFARLREQASAQSGSEPFTLIRPQPADMGLTAIPPLHDGDMYFDLEGDPFAEIPTLDYLWAFSDSAGEYHHMWAHSPAEEQDALEWFLKELRLREAAGGDWHVYHYNTYELTSLRRVANAHPDPDRAAELVAEVERFITERFVDLYRHVENGVRTREGTTSLKTVERIAGYDRTAGASADAVARGDDSILEYERYIMSDDEQERAAILKRIRDYNRHDVLATAAVHRWTFDRGAELDEDDLTPAPEPYVSSDAVVDRIARTDAMSKRLHEAAAHGPLLSGLSADGAEMLAHMLEWHRAEMVVQYLDRLRLQQWARNGGDSSVDLAPAETWNVALNGPAPDRDGMRPGTEHESALVDIEFVKEIGPKSTRKNAAIVWEYRCRPGSWKVREGKKMTEVLPVDSEESPRSFIIEDIDPQEGIFRISRQDFPGELDALVIDDYVNDTVVWESLMRLAEDALTDSPSAGHRLGISMLDAHPPLPTDQMDASADDAGDRARGIAAAMTSGLLPIQGPPGTGKTWVGARLIGDALQRGASASSPIAILITANSHRVINNLMLETVDYCAGEGLTADFAHVSGVGKGQAHPAIDTKVKSGELHTWISDHLDRGESVVVGATKFALCRQDMANQADLLVIDEAGQLSLADACAVAQVAPTAIALGDPQQLAAPVQASHHESVDVSLLKHITGDLARIADERGVFLDVTYRMHPEVCRVVADLAYDGDLRSAPQAIERHISGDSIVVEGQSIPVRPGVVWIPVESENDEVRTTIEVLEQLVGHARVTTEAGASGTLTWDEVRVVAPHNAHVNRLAAGLPDEAQVGTVDRFQGQQGHVVVYSMGRLAESPGDVPFLYELNRLNVALSRARLMAIVISHRDAAFPPVASPEHLLMASRFITVVGRPPG